MNGVYHFFFKELMKNCNCVISSSVSFEAMANSVDDSKYQSLKKKRGVECRDHLASVKPL